MRVSAVIAFIVLVTTWGVEIVSRPDPLGTTHTFTSTTTVTTTTTELFAVAKPAEAVDSPAADTYLVTRVIDGDTIEVAYEGRRRPVRYIGIDTPETVHPSRPIECFGYEAAERNKALVEGKYVRLKRDISDTDKYGRLLRYVYVGDEFVNLALVRDGYAMVTTYPPDVRHTNAFLSAQHEAREGNVGLWGSVCTNAPVPEESTASQSYTAPDTTCIIKGNIGQSTGEKIYHVPGCEYYAKHV